MSDLSKLRICFLAGTLGQGGAERQLHYLLRSLCAAGADVSMLTLTQGEYWESRIAEMGVPIHFVGGHASRARRAVEIVRQVRRLSPHVIHSQHFYTNLYAVMAARLLKAREIGAVRSDAVHEVAQHSRRLGLASLRWPRTLAANSQCGITNAVKLGVSPDRIVYLPNAIDVDSYPASAEPSNDQTHICFVGRLVPEKRVDILLSALRLLSQQRASSWKATIVGDGPERARLESLAIELGLSKDRVEFVGAASDPRHFYQSASVFAMTSDWEGTPNALLEAMASGVPVVATSVGGVPEIVTHGETGLLASAGDVQSLAGHLESLCANTETRRQMGQNARRSVKEKYGVDRLAGRLTDLYKAALA